MHFRAWGGRARTSTAKRIGLCPYPVATPCCNLLACENAFSSTTYIDLEDSEHPPGAQASGVQSWLAVREEQSQC